jgi:type VI secretion system protein ImpH
VASEDWREDAPVIRDLLNQGRLYSFFQAVHLLQSIGDATAGVGELGPAEKETVRFQGNASLEFPASDIEAIERLPGPANGDARFLVTVNHLGLYGPPSPLPTFYTEDILADDPEESVFRAFLDLFNHRFVSLLYRCWRKYRYYIQYEPGAKDPFSQWLFALIGLLHPNTREKDDIAWVRLIPYAGLLSMKARSSFALRSVVSYYFGGIPVRIEEAVLDRVWIEGSQLNRLGRANSDLGEDCLVGSSVPDLAGKFRAHLGPFDWETFVEFLPDGPHHEVLRDLIAFVVTDRLSYDVVLHVFPAEIPPLGLAQDSPCRLGWSSWLGDPEAGEATVTLKGR